jgi:DNA-binding transcriptional MerR regulator
VPLRDDLLPIGRLARLSRLSIKALRVYEREQLLVPAWTDPHNGYRYYAPAQVRTAATIALLRSAGVSLPDIRRLLDAEGDSLREALTGQKQQIERDIVRREAALRALDRLLVANDLLPYAVSEADLPAVVLAAVTEPVASEHLTTEVASLVRRLQQRVGEGRGGEPVVGLYPIDLPDPCPVTVGVPWEVDSGLPTSVLPGLRRVEVPAARVLETVHEGPYDALPLAYAAVFSAAAERSLTPTGEVRETYLNDPQDVSPAEALTRIAIPVTSQPALAGSRG